MTVSARIIADSISPSGIRLTSVQVVLHRMVLAELNTHRVFSRSYRSSRAVPVAKLLEEVKTNPAMPVFWGKNQQGMQAAEELEGGDLLDAKDSWTRAAKNAVYVAEYLSGIGLHKQIANRLLEPFLYTHGVITSTEWQNFFGLRLDKAAQPEMRVLAEAIYRAMDASTPTKVQFGEWHLPYIDDRTRDSAKAWLTDHPDTDNPDEEMSFIAPFEKLLIRQSVARCARVSYTPFDDDKPSSLEDDLVLYHKLVGAHPMHASPAEHQGTPDNNQHGNFTGWIQYRKLLRGEARAPLPEGYKNITREKSSRL